MIIPAVTKGCLMEVRGAHDPLTWGLNTTPSSVTPGVYCEHRLAKATVVKASGQGLMPHGAPSAPEATVAKHPPIDRFQPGDPTGEVFAPRRWEHHRDVSDDPRGAAFGRSNDHPDSWPTWKSNSRKPLQKSDEHH